MTRQFEVSFILTNNCLVHLRPPSQPPFPLRLLPLPLLSNPILALTSCSLREQSIELLLSLLVLLDFDPLTRQHGWQSLDASLRVFEELDFALALTLDGGN